METEQKPDYDKMIAEIPVRTKIKVGIEMSMIDLITRMGYREDKMWDDSENDKLTILMTCAKELSDRMFKDYYLPLQEENIRLKEELTKLHTSKPAK